jgi:DNA topoisomerase-1
MDCGFMSWDVPTEEDCPSCGKSLFKKSGKGRMKPFCINEACANFLPEDQRGYRRRVKTENGDPETAVVEELPEEKEEKKPAKKTAAKKTAAKKSTAKKTTTKKAAAKKTAEKKTTTKKTTKKSTRKTAKEAEEA